MEPTVDVEIDIPDEIFLKLAKAAHEQGITFNHLVVNILQEYVDGKRQLPQEDWFEVALRDKVANIVSNGVTIETLKDFASAYIHWFEGASAETNLLSDIIQDGFDLADERDFGVERESDARIS